MEFEDFNNHSNTMLEDKDDSLWYHSDLSRKACEKLLRRVFRMPHPDRPDRTGVFLVRDGSKPKHRFVLSRYSENQLQHIPVHQHGTDVFFSLDGEKIVHGLDELVKFYQQNDDESLGISLSSFSAVKGKAPPLSFCKIGQQRLLHRAVIMNHFEIVNEAVKSPLSSLDVKDSEGKTALHYACLIENVDPKIPELLIKNDASLLIRDSSGKVPFTYACEKGRKEIAQMMIAKNSDVIQYRNSGTLDVALHVAVRFNQKEIVKLLLANSAPLNPKNKDGKFPIDLAADERREEILMLLSQHRPMVKTSKSQWMHGALTRKEAHSLLIKERDKLRQTLPDENKSLIRGLFMVRFSKNTIGYVISMLENDDLKNYEIRQSEDYFHLDQGVLMWSIEHLIQHYMKFTDGLTSKLTIPLKALVKPSSVEPSYDAPKSHSNINYFTKSDDNRDESIYSDIKESDYDEIVGGERNTYIWLKKSTPVPINGNFDELFIDEANLEISSKQLGEGQFGTVNKGILVLPGKSCQVAIKTLRDDQNININYDTGRFCSFLREAGTMMIFDHPHIVKMLGLVKNPPMRIVQELQALGSLLTYLEEHGKDITSYDINIWATQIAEGMKYLEMKQFVHRDLAARNILLASKTHARISDFGLSRTISVENRTFNQFQKEKLPLKWYAPECFRGKFSHASDVWSFAVTLWEAYTKGEEPYQSMNAFEVLSFVMQGGRLSQPTSCPNDTFKMMLDCWQRSGADRPSFQSLAKYFKRNAPIYENRNLLMSK